MEVIILIQNLTIYLRDFLKLQFVLSGFTQHLASQFGKSFSNHSYRYDFSNDLPSCFASYCVNSGSLVNYEG